MDIACACEACVKPLRRPEEMDVRVCRAARLCLPFGWAKRQQELHTPRVIMLMHPHKLLVHAL